ncbi:MAG: AAA family ATPase, partial [Endomicrobium sp.]|nr:AAA family ATPase [Endomicrobium sp.]
MYNIFNYYLLQIITKRTYNEKLPLSTQSFEVLHNDNAIYVDKTQYMFNLINNGRIYFLSRPRRFG